MFEAIRTEYYESKKWAKQDKLTTAPIDGETQDKVYWKMAKMTMDCPETGSIEDKIKKVRDSWRGFLRSKFAWETLCDDEEVRGDEQALGESSTG